MEGHIRGWSWLHAEHSSSPLGKHASPASFVSLSNYLSPWVLCLQKWKGPWRGDCKTMKKMQSTPGCPHLSPTKPGLLVISSSWATELWGRQDVRRMWHLTRDINPDWLKLLQVWQCSGNRHLNCFSVFLSMPYEFFMGSKTSSVGAKHRCIFNRHSTSSVPLSLASDHIFLICEDCSVIYFYFLTWPDMNSTNFPHRQRNLAGMNCCWNISAPGSGSPYPRGLYATWAYPRFHNTDLLTVQTP